MLFSEYCDVYECLFCSNSVYLEVFMCAVCSLNTLFYFRIHVAIKSQEGENSRIIKCRKWKVKISKNFSILSATPNMQEMGECTADARERKTVKKKYLYEHKVTIRSEVNFCGSEL